MIHNFTDDQIISAIRKMPMITDHNEYVAKWEFDMFSQFLDALPEPQDEWQPCRFEDIRKGDRVQYETPDALIKPKHPVLRNFGDDLGFVGGMKVWDHPDVKWYRIPAPVQHPDPEKHPVIIVHESNPAVYDYPLEMMWDGGNCYESPKVALHVKSITRFTPAKVVPEDD